MNGAKFGESPYLTSEEAANYLRFPTAEAFRVWARRNGLTALKRGRKLLFDRRDLDAKLKVA